MSFVLLDTMIMLKLFIGVILKSMEEAEGERNRAQREKSLSEDGTLTVAEELVLLEEELAQLASHARVLRRKVDRHEM